MEENVVHLDENGLLPEDLNENNVDLNPFNIKGSIEIDGNYVADKAFHDFTIITNIRLTDRVEKIGTSAFENCFRLVEFICGTNIKRIGKRAFWGCAKLKNIRLPDGLETIDDYAFGACSCLTKISIPSSVKHLGKHIIGIGETEIHFDPTNIMSGKDCFHLGNSASLIVPKGKKQEAIKFLERNNLARLIKQVKEEGEEDVEATEAIPDIVIPEEVNETPTEYRTAEPVFVTVKDKRGYKFHFNVSQITHIEEESIYEVKIYVNGREKPVVTQLDECTEWMKLFSL